MRKSQNLCSQDGVRWSDREVKILKRILEDSILKEEYEVASIIRDEIKICQVSKGNRDDSGDIYSP